MRSGDAVAVAESEPTRPTLTHRRSALPLRSPATSHQPPATSPCAHQPLRSPASALTSLCAHQPLRSPATGLCAHQPPAPALTSHRPLRSPATGLCAHQPPASALTSHQPLRSPATGLCTHQPPALRPSSLIANQSQQADPSPAPLTRAEFQGLRPAHCDSGQANLPGQLPGPVATISKVFAPPVQTPSVYL